MVGHSCVILAVILLLPMSNTAPTVIYCVTRTSAHTSV
jgi:hypothetical protein